MLTAREARCNSSLHRRLPVLHPPTAGWLSGAILWLVVCFPALAVQASTPNEEMTASLEPRHERFLEETALLLSEIERLAFIELRQPYQRDEFIREFWKRRDPFPETVRNEFRDTWEASVDEVRNRFEEFESDRAKIMLLNGPPNRSFRVRCPILRELDIWYYRESPVIRGEFYMVFARVGGDYRLWSPVQGLNGLLLFEIATSPQEGAQRISQECSRSDQILQALALSPDWQRLEEERHLVPQVPDEWVESFLALSTNVPEDAEPLAARLEIQHPGRHQSRTIVQALVAIAPGQHSLEEGQTTPFLVDGDILRHGELFESFRYRFDPPVLSDEEIPLVLQRYLRPGPYTLVLKVRDVDSNRYYTERRDLEVPNLRFEAAKEAAETLDEPEVGAPLPFLEEATAAIAASGSPDHSLRLLAPEERLLTGRVRVEAEVAGNDVARVAFHLNGRRLLSKVRPPYSVELDLGGAPRTHRLEAEAEAEDGTVLASDELILNGGPHRFDIRLIEPEGGRSYRRSVRAVAEVDVPQLEVLDRVEFYINDRLVASLFQPPFVQPIPVPPNEQLAYVRAVAILGNGNRAEDIVFVNSPDLLDSVDVNLVELYATVLDRRGKPAEGLSIEDFRILEDGKEQTARRFELVKDQPIHAGILLDTSTSMENRLEEAEEAALHFFQLVLTDKDRASLLTFNDRPDLVVSFTNDVEILAGGLAGVVAEGETALYDSLAFALHYFSGIRGKRALILLSDGEDVSSEYEYEEVLDYARRTGVAIYSIGLSISSRELDIRGKLSKLCRETGGQCFFIETAAELKSVYARIERELRSQYLIAYQSSETGDSERFRQVELKVKKPGLRAQTARGYYP